MGIRERLTPGPLTLLSLLVRIRSLSLRALSLREFLEQVVHKEFRTKFVLKSLDFIMFFAKEVHLFISEGGKGKGHLGEPRDKRGKGIWGCGSTSSSSAGAGVKEPPREPLGRPPSILSKKVVCSQRSTVGLQRLTVATVDRRKSRLSTNGISKSRSLSDFSCRPLSGLAVDRLRPSVNR